MRGITRYGYVLKNSGDFVLLSSIEMAFELFEAHGAVERKHEELRLTNLKLGEKEEKYRNLVEKISDLIYEVNAQGAITYLSPKTKDIMGYDPAELTGRNFIELVHDDDKSLLAGRFLELSRGVEYALEYRLLNSRGDILWVRTKSSPIWENERFSGARGLLIDITESKLMEEKLHESREELWWLFKSMLNAFAMFQSVFDDDGTFISYRFVYINDACERITGVRNDEIRGRTVHEVWPGTEPEWIRRYGEVVVTGVSQTFDMYHDPTGKLYHCNVYRPGDTRDRFCVIFEDITECRRVQEALERQRNFAESIVETAQAIILVLDPRGRIISFNAFFEEISGYRLEEVRGRDWFDTFLPRRGRAVTMDLFAEAINNIQTRGNIDSIVTRNGRERQIEWYDKTLKDADDTLIGLLCVGLDVTERMLMEKETKSFRTRDVSICGRSPGISLKTMTTSGSSNSSRTGQRIRKNLSIKSSIFTLTPMKPAMTSWSSMTEHFWKGILPRLQEKTERISEGSGPSTTSPGALGQKEKQNHSSPKRNCSCARCTTGLKTTWALSWAFSL
ncbi:MAG: PAS domain-containing protein [Candidatus Xenobiia bacterium LiM19]